MFTVSCLRLSRHLVLLGLALAVTLPSVSAADRLPCRDGQCGTADRGVSLLSRIPYVSRLFKNTGIGGIATEEGVTACCEVIGVDFDFSFAAPCENTCVSTGKASQCAVAGGPGCAVAAAPGCDASCPAECASESTGKCDESGCQLAGQPSNWVEFVCPAGYGAGRFDLPNPGYPSFSSFPRQQPPYAAPPPHYPAPQPPYPSTQSSSNTAAPPYPGGQYLPAGPPLNFAHPAPLAPNVWMSQILPLVADNAGLRAQLQLHETLAEQRLQAFGAVMEAAQAEVKVRNEAQGERDELVEQLTSTLIENAQLKAKLELAEQREALVRELVATQIENFQLKQQVESLARRVGEEGVQLTGHAESLAPSPAREARSVKRTNRKKAELR